MQSRINEMDTLLSSIPPSDPVWLTIAFVSGFLVKLAGLPPLVGFLFAGFLLNALGAEGGAFLSSIADLGITLLLFSIGLKLKVKSLARAEVWGVASVHMLLVTLLLSAIVFLLTTLKLPMFQSLTFTNALLIGFVMSFSSTVFAIKILDELGATSASHGIISIGVLVMQDIVAVIFLAISVGKIPSIWALGLFMLIPLRHLLAKVLDYSGHGELLVLFGIVLALGGADIFELVGMKGDVGALILGMLLANHAKANELSKSLMSFKDLFLVGFFLSVGMTALPGWQEFLVALVFIVFLPVKTAIYFVLFNLFNLRASTSWRTSLNLANYSEFGLIVGSLAIASGWLAKEWLAVFAIVLSLSFILSAPLVSVRDHIYTLWRPLLKKTERKRRIAGEEDMDLKHVEVVIFGMGRMGSAAYQAIERDYHERLLGVEIDAEKAQRHQEAKRFVIAGDATNLDFWKRAATLIDGLQWVLLMLPTHSANMAAVLLLKEMGYQGRIAATSRYDDEAEQLKAMGVDYSFNIYAEAGIGFANDLKGRLNRSG